MPSRVEWNRVSAVFLDAGNTLISIDFPWIRVELEKLGVRCDEAALERAEAAGRPFIAKKARDAKSEPDVDWRAVYFATMLRSLPDGAVAEPDRIPAIAEALVPILFASGSSMRLWSRVLPSTRPALDVLTAMGVPLHVISNSDGTVEEGLRRNDLRDYFGVVVDSGLVGAEKPDPRIFTIALEMTGCDASEALYVGDLYELDVLGAQSAGMQAVLLDPYGDWADVQCERVPDLMALADRLRIVHGE